MFHHIRVIEGVSAFMALNLIELNKIDKFVLYSSHISYVNMQSVHSNLPYSDDLSLQNCSMFLENSFNS